MLAGAAVNGRFPRCGRFARPTWAAALAAAVISAGCKPNKRYDLIESELRTRDRELRDTRAALEQARALNHAYEQQAHPGRPADSVFGGPLIVPLKDVQIGRGTGGFDEDDCPGDEALQVVIVPRDEDASAVKVPARATVWAWEITGRGVKNPVGAWDVSADRLRPTWRGGLFGAGYTVTLPWQTAPQEDRVRVAVRLTTLDGRVFEADRDVSVRPPRRGGVAPVPPGTQELPPPVQGFPVRPPAPAPPVPGRELLPGAAPPPGVPPVVPGSPVPPGSEELPPPSRKSMLLPPVRP